MGVHGGYYKSGNGVQEFNRQSLVFAAAVAARQPDRTLIVSPYNALTCLAMAAKGAVGPTRDEMARLLFGVPSVDLDRRITDFAALHRGILGAMNGGGVTLKTANAVWANSDSCVLRPDYAADVMRIFNAAVQGLPFSDGATPGIMNEWGRAHTDGLIPSFIDRLAPDDMVVLASAFYFKGDWAAPFNPALTTDKTFLQDSGAALTLPMMGRSYESSDGMRYMKGPDYQAVSLVYGNPHIPPARLVLIRPDNPQQGALDWLTRQAAGGSDPAWLSLTAYQGASGFVELPRIDIAQSLELNGPLQDMGVRCAFQPLAGFSRIAEAQDLSLGEVRQKAVFRTDEKGSEAAFITSGTLRSLCMPVSIHVAFNRSFAVALQDMASGTLLFTGAVDNPGTARAPQP